VSNPAVALPNVAELLGRVLQRVPVPQRPLLVALAERLAAERYRGWAESVGSAERRAGLLACAEREEAIASRVESLHADAASEQRRILDANPDLPEINRSVFAGRPLEEQFAIQAQGERAGAALWRALAQAAAGPARDTYHQCARLEEESAAYLESLAATSR
jgi:hypothetical protein